MVENGQTALVKENGLLPFELLALEPIRTICKKIMSLVRFSYGKHPLDDLMKKIRHTYDIHQLLQQKEFLNFFESPAFDEMLLKVANDDVASYKNANDWLVFHPNEAIIFKDLVNVWNEIKVAYNENFRNLVYGSFPKETDIFETLKKIKERLIDIKWTIEIKK